MEKRQRRRRKVGRRCCCRSVEKNNSKTPLPVLDGTMLKNKGMFVAYGNAILGNDKEIKVVSCKCKSFIVDITMAPLLSTLLCKTIILYCVITQPVVHADSQIAA